MEIKAYREANKEKINAYQRKYKRRRKAMEGQI